MSISTRISQLEARTGTHSPAERADQRKRLADAVRVMIDGFNEADRTLPVTALAGMPTLQRWAWSLRFDAVPITLAGSISSGGTDHAHS